MVIPHAKICLEKCKGCSQNFQYEFTRKSKKFCTEKCEQAYFRKLHQPPVTFPKWRCEKCGEETELDFYPNKDITKFEAFIKSHKCKI